jgi:hypothetical protein
MIRLASLSRTASGRDRCLARARSRASHWAALMAVGAVLSVANERLTAQEPTAEPAVSAIIALFKTNQVVGVNAGHRMKDLDDLLLNLIRAPEFIDAADDIVVECGNSRYQGVLDRYIQGEDVALADVQPVWRNTTVPQMCSVSPFYAQLFPLVRRINQGLSPAKRLRVVAADPPIDWSAITTQAGFARYYGARDSTIAAIMEREVLSRNRKALMLFGSAHLAHGLTTAVAASVRQLPGGFAVASAVARYEEHYPGITFTIDLFGCGAMTPAGSGSASWPVPSLVRTSGTRLASPANSPIRGPDGLLYLGRPEWLLYELRPAFVFLDDTVVAELRRQVALMPSAPSLDEFVDRSEIQRRDAANSFLCNPRR